MLSTKYVEKSRTIFPNLLSCPRNIHFNDFHWSKYDFDAIFSIIIIKKFKICVY